jgi:endonuclease YncB( thermonuclease family)
MADTFDNFPSSYEVARQIGCFRAWCTRVVDGDTYDFICDLGLTVRVKIRVRLRDFDTAEFFHHSNSAELAHAEQAIATVAELIYDQPCLIRTYRTKSDADVVTVGRYVADVYYRSASGQWRDIKLPMHDAALEKRTSY